MLLTLTTMASAHEGNYSMSSNGDGYVFILNVENGAVKMRQSKIRHSTGQWYQGFQKVQLLNGSKYAEHKL